MVSEKVRLIVLSRKMRNSKEKLGGRGGFFVRKERMRGKMDDNGWNDREVSLGGKCQTVDFYSTKNSGMAENIVRDEKSDGQCGSNSKFLRFPLYTGTDVDEKLPLWSVALCFCVSLWA